MLFEGDIIQICNVIYNNKVAHIINNIEILNNVLFMTFKNNIYINIYHSLNKIGNTITIIITYKEYKEYKEYTSSKYSNSSNVLISRSIEDTECAYNEHKLYEDKTTVDIVDDTIKVIDIYVNTRQIQITYDGCTKYKLIILPQTQALINKKLKNTYLECVYKINKLQTLYSFNNDYLLNLDINGYIYYYADTLDIYDNNTITQFLNNELQKQTTQTTQTTDLEQILDKYNYKIINTAINKTSYNIDNISICNSNNSDSFKSSITISHYINNEKMNS